MIVSEKMNYENLGLLPIAETAFKVNYFDEKNKILVECWLSNSKNMKEDDFRRELTNYKALVLKLQAEKVIVDSSDLHFVIPPHLQTWMAKEIFTAYPLVGMKKKAFLMPQDFFTQISMEQHLEEDKTYFFQSAFFDDFEKAYRWVMQ